MATTVIDLARVPSVDDYDTLYDRPAFLDRLTYWPVSAGVRLAFDVARPGLLDALGTRRAERFTLGGEPIGRLGRAVALRAGLAQPTQAVAHRNQEFAYHHDVTNPYPCINATVFFREDVTGGYFVLPDRRTAFACDDGWVVIFDAQEIHGTTPMTMGTKNAHRVALTFYCPT